jgi:multidrug efflux system outer membrane protein
MKRLSFIVAVLAGALVGCRVGPNYQRPAAFNSQPLPESFEGVGTNTASSPNVPAELAQWKPATPSADRGRGEWWAAFDDDVLNGLETLAAADNQNLAAGLARFEQARALVKVARSSFFPQLNFSPSVTRQRTSANAPQLGVAAGQAYQYNNFTLPADLSWEVDLWDRIRRQAEGARARLVATADDLESLRLAVQAEIASDYYVLRALEAERRILVGTIETYRRSLELTQNRRRGGVVTELDVSEAETQLRIAEAQLPAIDLQHENLLHAMAMLCGRPATGFQLPRAQPPRDTLPTVPAGLPSELLERRPDIAAAERRMAAANADIGVAMSAFYPRIVFNGAAGFQSVNAGTLFDWPSRLWAIGPSLELPLFTGGRNRAQLDLARRSYDEAVANYRTSVLTAFQEVEDQLAAQRLLAAQLDAENAALASARQTLEIANNRYKAGLVTYLEVATANSAALAQERAVVQLQGERQVALISLIKALGGTWRKTG